MSVQTIDVDSHPDRKSVTPSVQDDEKVNAASPESGKVVEKDIEEDALAGTDDGHREEPILPISRPKTPDGGTSNASWWNWERIQAFLREDVDTDAATGPLSAFCFMTVSRKFNCL